MRFRAVMMTSFAFILGLVPLVIAARRGAQISRRASAPPVFAGMLVASAIGIFMIPMLYVVFQRMREWSGGRSASGAPQEFSSPSRSPQWEGARAAGGSTARGHEPSAAVERRHLPLATPPRGGGAALPFASSRAISIFWISLVPS